MTSSQVFLGHKKQRLMHWISLKSWNSGKQMATFFKSKKASLTLGKTLIIQARTSVWRTWGTSPAPVTRKYRTGLTLLSGAGITPDNSQCGPQALGGLGGPGSPQGDNFENTSSLRQLKSVRQRAQREAAWEEQQGPQRAPPEPSVSNEQCREGAGKEAPGAHQPVGRPTNTGLQAENSKGGATLQGTN